MSAAVQNGEKAPGSYSFLPARNMGFLGRLNCASHSVRQSLQHLPRQRNAIMLPPQSGQTRFSMAEIVLGLRSPVSIVLMFALLIIAAGFTARGNPALQCARRSRDRVLRSLRVSLVFCDGAVLVCYGVHLVTCTGRHLARRDT